MARTMKALVKSRPEPGLWMEEVPVPEPGINDVLIRILKTGICGTDVHIYNWDDWAQKTIPMGLVVGHEFVGRVEAIGSNVTGFEPGDLVSGEGHIVCGRCRNCLAGRRHLCPHTKGVGVNRAGAYAEFICIPMTNVWGADPAIAQEVLACFDPFGNAVHTALTFPVLGEDVLVTGAGPIGLMAAAVVRHAGARHVVVTDPNPSRRALADRMGATLSVDTREKPLAKVQEELGMKEGFDVGLEMSGNGGAFREMLAAMCHGGQGRHAGDPERADHHRLEHGDLRQPHDQGGLRPGDVRDLVQDDRHGPERARHHSDDQPPASRRGLRDGLPGPARRGRGQGGPHLGGGVVPGPG